MRPVVDRLEENYAGRVQFVPINIDTEAGQATMRKYHVTGTPTLLITHANGGVLFRRSGGTTYALLQDALEAALQANAHRQKKSSQSLLWKSL